MQKLVVHCHGQVEVKMFQIVIGFCTNLLNVSRLGLFFLLVSGYAQAAVYSFTGVSYPACSGGTWSQAGNTWTCTGSFTLNTGDTISTSTGMTIFAYNGMTLNGSNTVGSNNNNVNLQSNYGSITISATSTIYGSISLTSGSVALTGTTVSGSITSTSGSGPISLTISTIGGSVSTSGSINLSGGSISGNVTGGNGVTATNSTAFGGSITSSNGSISASGGSVTGNVSGGNGVTATNSTVFSGNITASNGSVSVSGGSVAGSVSGSNGVTASNSTVFGSTIQGNSGTVTLTGGSVAGNVSGNGLSSNGTAYSGTITSQNSAISLTGGSVAGSVSGNGVTTSSTNINGGVNSNNSPLTITGGTIAGVITGNGITISNVTMVYGSISDSNSPINISNSSIGLSYAAVSISSGNVINITNHTTVYGNVTSGTWSGALNIDSSSTVYGVCSDNNNSTSNPSNYPRCNAASTCIPATTAAGPTPIIAGSGKLNYGNNTTVNGTNVTGSSNGIPTTGVTTAVTPVLPALVPSAFPASSATSSTTSSGPVAPGNYGTLTVNGNPTIFSGGTYYITTLNVNGTLQLGPGKYYINTLTMNGNNPTMTVTGAVQIYIGSQFAITQDHASINSGNGSSAGNLQINLYNNASFNANSDSMSFTGLIYSPYSTSTVSIRGNPPSITGGIVTAGSVTLPGQTTINYNATVQSQMSSLVCSNGSATGPDHIEIDYSGYGLTCSPASVTVKACANSGCTSFYTGGVTGTISPGNTSFTIASGSSSASTTVQQSTVGTATLSIGTTTPSSSYSNTCSTTGSTSCSFAFRDSGFVITAPDHVACTNAQVKIQALEKSTGTQQCVPAYSTTTRSINLNFAYTNPTSGSKTITDVTNSSQITSTNTAHSLYFDSTGSTALTISYPDVGQLTLNVTDTSPTGVAMSGSGTFIAGPSNFVFSATTIGPIKSGNNFSSTITAMTGSGAACSSATQAKNFGNESTPESAIIGFTKCLPTGTSSSSGSFSGTATFSSGKATLTNLNWSEVGNGDLTATSASGSGTTLVGHNYLGSTSSALNVTGNSGTTGSTCSGTNSAGTVGNFIPDHFNTAITAPISSCGTVVSPCLAGNGMAYSGQKFSLTVSAMNAGNNVTTNYFAGSGFANAVTLAAYTALGGSTSLSSVGTLSVTSETAFVAGTLLAGTVTDTSEIFTFTTIPTIPTDIFIRATDTVDGVSSLRTPSATSIEGGIAVVSGRVKVSNAYGSDLLPLQLLTTAQLYNASSYWVTSLNDSLTTLTLPSSYNVGTGTTTATMSPASGMMASGMLTINLSKPSNGSGSVTITPGAPSYLPLTPGTATFGIYKGNNSIIYMRENY
jgi:MSHA biogenesis protein MshQ